jgi:endonuclease/exonuclease/phosphatase family metal-dependent hydrolase
MNDPGEIRVLTWNLFHGQDGAGVGPTIASTLLGCGVDDGSHLHLNRKWIDEMAELIASRRPTVAALQEVPPLAVDRLASITGMRSAHALMPPLIGSVRARGRLAAANPDLWRTHEGTANVVLVGAPWEIVPGGVWTVRHNPPRFVARNAASLRLDPRESLHWLLEPRRLVAVRIRHPSGRTLTIASLHCHNSLDWEVIAREVRRVIPRVLERVPVDEPMLVAGDLNAAGVEHPAVRILVEAGLAEDTTGDLMLDHVFHRALRVVEAPRALPPPLREVTVTWRGRVRRVVLSDHDPVEGIYAFADSAG